MALPGNSQDELLAAAAAVEAESDHPIALAIMAATGSPIRGSDVQVLPGVGVAGVVDGQLVRVSRLEHPRLPEPLSTAIAARYARGETVVVVERGGDVLGAIAVTSPLRPEAKPSIRRLHEMGLGRRSSAGTASPRW